jgi:hypothetical protein
MEFISGVFAGSRYADPLDRLNDKREVELLRLLALTNLGQANTLSV